MSHIYKKYLSDRLIKGCKVVSDAEINCRNAIVSFGIKGKFLLLQLNSDDCNIYECETNDAGSIFRIKSYKIYSHKLKGVFDNNLTKSNLEKYSLAYFKQDGKYVYDEYYDTLYSDLAEHNHALQQALGELPDRWGDVPLYIDGIYSEIPSVIYALQRDAANITPMRLVQPSSQGNPNTLKCWFPKVLKEKISTNNCITFLDCLKESKTVFVPLDVNSLDSVFYRKIKWRHIIPNMNKDCKIAGFDCKCIILRTEVDGFQNVFCRATDAYGKSKSVLVYNALNVSVDVEDKAVATPLPSVEKEKKPDMLTDNNEKRYSELIEDIDIMTGDTGHSYSTLFGKYLNGASAVVLAEPYIVHPHQWDNLKEFISLLIEVGRVNSFKLITQNPELVKIPDYMERSKFISDFNSKLMSIKNEISCSHVEFSWKLSGIHKRWLDIDDYHIDLDYGLDLYIKPEKGTVLSSIQVLRKCKENHIKVYKQIKIKP